VALNCEGSYAKYNKKWDDLLWLYAFNYQLIQDTYSAGGKKEGFEFGHIPGYI
jgi:hypothetical protein